MNNIQNTVQFLQTKYNTIIDNRVFIYGGSHGGFIGGHLVSRPELQYVTTTSSSLPSFSLCTPPAS